MTPARHPPTADLSACPLQRPATVRVKNMPALQRTCVNMPPTRGRRLLHWPSCRSQPHLPRHAHHLHYLQLLCQHRFARQPARCHLYLPPRHWHYYTGGAGRCLFPAYHSICDGFHGHLPAPGALVIALYRGGLRLPLYRPTTYATRSCFGPHGLTGLPPAHAGAHHAFKTTADVTTPPHLPPAPPSPVLPRFYIHYAFNVCARYRRVLLPARRTARQRPPLPLPFLRNATFYPPPPFTFYG